MLGNTANETDGLDYYTIQSVSGDTITLSASGTSLTTESDRVVRSSRSCSTRVSRPPAAQSVPVYFSNNGFNDTGRPGDSITRTDGGSFIADGYVVNSLLRVGGGSQSDTGPSTSLPRGRRRSDGKTLTLVSTDFLTTRGDSTHPVTVTLTRGVVPHLDSIVIDRATT